MNKTEQAFQQAIAVWTSIMSHDYFRFDGESNTLKFTSRVSEAQIDTYGYFHSESDNDDVLYNYFIIPLTENERERERIYYFVELLREDFEAKSTKLPRYVGFADFNCRDNEDIQRYILVSRMNRLNTYANLVSGHYNRFLTLTFLG